MHYLAPTDFLQIFWCVIKNIIKKGNSVKFIIGVAWYIKRETF